MSSLPSIVASPLSAGLTREFMTQRAPELARDIAAKLDSASALAKAAGLTDPQWEALKRSNYFRDMVVHAQSELSGSLGVAELIRRQAGMALSQGGILEVASMASNVNVPPAVRLDSYEFLADLAKVSGKTQQGPSGGNGGGPLIQINFPGRDAPLILDGSAS